MEHPTVYRTTQIDGLSIFYREAGPKDATTLLLLHGFPSSSRMFEPLFARLSDRYHLVAPDYPGFGHSDWLDPKQFDYTFDHIASVMQPECGTALSSECSRLCDYRSYGNGNWEFNDDGLMASRFASISDLPISESDRKYHWPPGRRPDDHPSLSQLGL